MSNVNLTVDGDGKSALITATASDRGRPVRIQARLDQDSVRNLVRALCKRAGLDEPWESTR